MKETFKSRLLGITAGLLMAFPVTGMAEEIFAPLAGMEMVDSTFISGRFSKNTPVATGEIVAMGVLPRNFSELYKYDCFSEESVKKAEELLRDYLKQDKEMQMVMRNRQNEMEYTVYQKLESEDKMTRMIIWSKDAPQSAGLVVIEWANGINPDEMKILH